MADILPGSVEAVRETLPETFPSVVERYFERGLIRLEERPDFAAKKEVAWRAAAKEDNANALAFSDSPLGSSETPLRLHQYIYQHHNRICVIGLAKDHSIFDHKIVSINFDVGSSSRLNNKGGMFFDTTTIICEIETVEKDAVEPAHHYVWKIRACMRGSLLQVNSLLVDDPDLLVSFPEEEGWIAILMPKFGEKPLENTITISRRSD